MAQSTTSLIRDISYMNSKRVSLFVSLPIEQQSRIFLRLSKHVQRQLIKKLTKENIILILENLDPDEGTDVLQLLPKKQQTALIAQLNENLRKNISVLLEFDEKTAAGLMSLDYVQVDSHEKIEAVVTQIKKHENKTGRLPTILVLKDGKLIGHLPGHKLVFAKPHETVVEYVKKVPWVNYLANFNTVLTVFKENPHQKVVVIGEHENILGVIYSDDVLQLIQEQTASSLYGFAGVNQEESAFDSVKKKVNSRYKWLMLNLFTTFLAASTVRLFEDTISANVLLAVYMPIVAGMGGNAGTQTLAVMVRSLSNADISVKALLGVMRNEISAGFINGVINGIIIAFVVMLLNSDSVVAITLAFAMIVNLTVAATFGTLMPILMKRVGKDPASSATIFITTATDIIGFFAFLGLASILL